MTSKKLKKFYEKLGAVYEEEKYVHSSGWGKSRRRFLKSIFRRYAKYVVKKSVLDIGCGGGIYLKIFKNAGAKAIFGADISHPALLRAKQRCADAMLICADAETLPIKSRFADFILSSETIEHLENPEMFFSEIYRILKDGGKAIITCPNWRGEKPVEVDVGILKNFGIEDDKYIHTAYKPDELEQLARKVGLHIIESGTFERDMRIWGRIYDVIWNSLFSIMQRFAPAGLIRFAYKFYSLSGGILYEILRLSGIALLMRKIFRRGPRSFLIAEKTLGEQE